MPDRVRSLRWPVLGLSGFVSAGIAIFLFTYLGAVAASGLEALVISAASGVAGYWLLRSARLALLAAAVPLMTAIFAFGLLISIATAFPVLCGVLIPHAVATILLPVSGAALVMLQQFVAEQSVDSDPDVAARTASSQVKRAAIMALSAAVIWRGFLLLPERVLRLEPPTLSTDVTVLASVLTALAGVPILFALLPLAAGAIRFDEDFVATANRLRETRARFLNVIGLVATPRWALSVLGIAVVFGAMAMFGATRVSMLWRAQGMLFPLVLLLIGAMGALGAKDWRAFFASALPAGVAATSGAVWCGGAVSLAVHNPDLATLSWIGGAPLLPVTAALAAGCSYAITAGLAAYRAFDDPLDVAFERALSDVGMPLVCICVSFSAILVPASLWPLPLLALVSGLVLTPAVMAVLEMLLPRFRSVEELYGRG